MKLSETCIYKIFLLINFPIIGCNSYFEPGTLLTNYPVDLSSSNKKDYRVVDDVDSCYLNGQYYYDYNGFQSKWKTASGFFTSKFKRRTLELEIKVRKSFIKAGFEILLVTLWIVTTFRL